MYLPGEWIKRKEEWWLTDYAAEIFENLLQKEKKRKKYRGRSPQLQSRTRMVSWMMKVAENYELCQPVLHLAVHYLDYFMDTYRIPDEQLPLVSLTCILIAAKVEEKDSLIPKITWLNRISCYEYDLKDFIRMEFFIMDFFQWKLLHPTAAHFAEYFSTYAVFETDSHAGQPVQSMEQLWLAAKQYIAYFLDASLRDHTFRNFFPSIIAAACIASMRICLLLFPTWPVHLQNMTKYNSEELTPCVEKLLRALEAEEKSAKAAYTMQRCPLKECKTHSTESSPVSI